MTARKPAPKTEVRRLTTAEAAAEAGAKVPTDHKPAANDDPMVIVNWKGQDWKVDSGVFDDIDYLEAAEKNFFATCGRMLVGDDQWDDFKKALRDPKTGRTTVTEVTDFMEAAGEKASAKNS